MSKKAREFLITDFKVGWKHFCECIDFRQSGLDAEAIRFMNEMPGKIIKSLQDFEPLRAPVFLKDGKIDGQKQAAEDLLTEFDEAATNMKRFIIGSIVACAIYGDIAIEAIGEDAVQTKRIVAMKKIEDAENAPQN